MYHYEMLINLIKQKRLKLYFILSIARSRSTSLQLSLSQAPEIDAQINLPFNSGVFSQAQDSNFIYGDFRDEIEATTNENIAARIYSVVNPIIEKNNRATILIHEHFDFLALNHLHMLTCSATDFIFCFRHPKIQFLSYMVGCFNKFFLEDDSLGQSKFSTNDVLTLLSLNKEQPNNTYMDEIIQRKNITCYKGDFWKRYTNGYDLYPDAHSFHELFNTLLSFISKELKVAWVNAKHTLDYLLRNESNIIMTDGEILVSDPTKTITSITENISGLSFCTDMIDNWHKNVGIGFTCFLTKENNPWNGPSRNSKGFTTKNDVIKEQQLCIDVLPQELRQALEEATVIYENFLQFSNIIH